jgi:hypothetical protein
MILLLFAWELLHFHYLALLDFAKHLSLLKEEVHMIVSLKIKIILIWNNSKRWNYDKYY